MATFPLALFSALPRTYSHKVEYILNGLHFMEFELSADVMAVELQLSHTEIDFALSLTDWLPHVDRTLALTNTNNFGATFEIANPNPERFNVTPSSGIVPPGAQELATTGHTSACL